MSTTNATANAVREFTSPPPVGDESQLTELLKPKPLVEMSDEELDKHLATCRAAMETPQTLKAAMSTKPKGTSAPKAKASQKILKGILGDLL